jgi:hypothetical protein
MYARASTQRKFCNSCCFSTATMIREWALVLRFTYIACLAFSLAPHPNAKQGRLTVKIFGSHTVTRHSRQHPSARVISKSKYLD